VNDDDRFTLSAFHVMQPDTLGDADNFDVGGVTIDGLRKDYGNVRFGRNWKPLGFSAEEFT